MATIGSRPWVVCARANEVLRGRYVRRRTEHEPIRRYGAKAKPLRKPTVPSFDVYAATPDGQRVALRDSHGRVHLARPTEAAPRVGAVLEGGPVSRGFALLQCGNTGKLYRFIVEELDAGPEVTAWCPRE